MKFTVILLFTCCLQVSAKVNSQGITLNVRNASLSKVFNEIKKQTGYTFMYTETMLKESNKVSMDIKNSTLQEALSICFLNQPFTYKIIDKTVVVQPKEMSMVNASNKISPPPFQPPIEIHGRVINQQGEPLQNVSVLIAGTTIGTTTGSDGRFRLTAPDNKNITLEISSVGYQTKRVSVGKQTEVNVILEQDITGLNDVVVIGYGTAKKGDLTGSVSRLDAKTFQNQSMTQVTDMLAGTTPGVYTTQSTSAEGGGAMQIRGPSSIGAGTEPLIVLDGAIYNGSVSDINPADVESIDVLRDASSAAVFGSKAASGVILINTKKGRNGKPTIDFSSTVGIAQTTHDLRPFSPQGYLNLHRDYLTQFNPNLPYGYYFQPDQLPAGITLDQWRNFSANPAADNVDEWITRIGLKPVEIENFKAGKATDWYDLVVGSALRQDYTLGVGGGSKDLKYYLSAGYLNNKGIITGDQFSTVRTRLNLDLKVTNWLDIGTNTQFASRNESVAPANLSNAASESPYGSMWNPDGSLKALPDDQTPNPLENYYGQKRSHITNTLFSILYAQIKLPFGIQYKISFQPNFAFSKNYNFWSTNTTTGSTSYIGGYGTREDSLSYGWLLDNILTWNKEIGIHKFDLTLLANTELSKSWLSKQANSNFSPNPNLTYNALQFGIQPSLSDNDEQFSGNALMARLNYTLLNKYLFTGSIRRDGYSAFGQQNPTAVFPAFAFAWKISDESFYKIPWMDQLKLRTSWGVNGNRDIGIYSALASLESTLGYDGANVESGVYNSTLSNIGLRWERTQSTNIGLDIGLFQNRIDMSIDAYTKVTTDLLMSRQLPIITGFSSIEANLGELDNRGFEVLINTKNIKTKNFDWRSSFTFSLNRNKIKSLYGDTGVYQLLGKTRSGELPDFTNQWFPGQALDVVWNYKVTGIWQLSEKDEAATYGMVPGDWKVTDVNGDKKYLQFDDKKFIGYTAPRYRIGLRNEFTFFQNFSASIFIRADLGHLRSMPFLTYNKSVFDRINTWSLPYWSPENPSNEYARNDFPDNTGKYNGGLIIYRPSGFVRVQNLSLSYHFPSALIERSGLKSLRVFTSMQNLFTFTNYPGFDPESGMTPMPKVFTLGLNLTL